MIELPRWFVLVLPLFGLACCWIGFSAGRRDKTEKRGLLREAHELLTRTMPMPFSLETYEPFYIAWRRDVGSWLGRSGRLVSMDKPTSDGGDVE